MTQSEFRKRIEVINTRLEWLWNNATLRGASRNAYNNAKEWYEYRSENDCNISFAGPMREANEQFKILNRITK